MSQQSWQETLATATTDGTAIANTTTEAIIYPNIVIPANYLQGTRLLRLTLYGKHSTTGTPTLTFALRWGGVSGTVLAQSGAITCGSTVTNAPFKIELYIQTRTNGSSGTVLVMGEALCWDDAVGSTGSATNAPAVAAMTSAGAAAPAAVTVDLTADTSLSITADWSAASTSNTLTGLMYVLESLT